ncbi:MAG: DHA2 family efflux MFS transporter permease subunit [Acidimicrobiales bacterium]
MPSRTGTRLSAGEGRVTVLRAAMAEFARGGYAGTSTEDIATRAEISQPYLFRLFGTKRELFIATMGLMHYRIEEAFRSAASGLTGTEAMIAMGDAYKELLGERDLLLVQLHAFAASDDEEVRRAARDGFRRLWNVVEQLTGLPEQDIRSFFAQGMLLVGLAVFTGASAAAAVSPSIGWLVTARAVQGMGGALIMPLSLTLLSAAVRPERRNLALGVWGAIGGTAVAEGPLVGGAVTGGWSWQYIFWINVPFGVVLLVLARWRLAESRGPRQPLDVIGVALAIAGLLGVVLGLVRANAHGWTSHGVLAPFATGAAGLAAFVWWELHSASPVLPLRLFRSRAFSAVNLAALFMSFGMFGSIFFLSQFLQVVQHYSPFAAGLRVLPWTGMPMLVAPLAAALTQRFGGRPVLVVGLALQATGLAWLALSTTPSAPYSTFWMAFVVSGVGIALFFVPLASVVLPSVRPELEGVASGTNAAFRELGGVLGIATLGAVFSARGGYSSGTAYVAGLTPAMWVGVGVVGLGALCALALPRRKATARTAGAPTPMVGSA